MTERNDNYTPLCIIVCKHCHRINTNVNASEFLYSCFNEKSSHHAHIFTQYHPICDIYGEKDRK